MIRTNLATRPFYNERLVHIWLALITVLTIAATIGNVARVRQYSRSDTRLASQAARDEARAATLRADAARLRATVDPRQVESASLEAHQANDLIDRRTFSWTELFNRFETTLPDEVRITSVRPKVDRIAGTQLSISLIAKSTDDVAQFIENLEATGAFKDIRGTTDERYDEQGLLEATMDARYLPAPSRVAEGAAKR
jgi:Fimbrial assembly protein (PilN)